MLSPTALKVASTVLNTLHSTDVIPHCTNVIPHTYWCYPPMYWIPSTVLKVSPTILKLSPTCTAVIPPQYWIPSTVLMLSPTVLMLSPTCTDVIPHCTEQPPKYWSYPPLYWATSTVLKLSPTVLMLSPNVLNNLQCTEQPPQYWTDVIWDDITVLSFLVIIKNYRIQDATCSEVEGKCKIDSFSNLQIEGKAPIVGQHVARSRERLAEQNLVRSCPEPSSLSLFLLS